MCEGQHSDGQNNPLNHDNIMVDGNPRYDDASEMRHCAVMSFPRLLDVLVAVSVDLGNCCIVYFSAQLVGSSNLFGGRPLNTN